MEHILPYLFFTIIGYLSGSIVYSYFLPKLFFKKDILKISDDGNPGCANVFKYVGVPMGILCLALDFSRIRSRLYRLPYAQPGKPAVCPRYCRADGRARVQPISAAQGRQGNQRFVWKLSGPYAAVFYGLVAGNTVCYSVYRIPAQPAQPARGGKLHGNACNEPAV